MLVSPDKIVSFGTLWSTLASILIYYGIVSNSEAENKYWLWITGVICSITFLMIIWFFSQGNGRQFFFNRWAFQMFEELPRTDVTLQLNGLGALLSVVIPLLIAMALFKEDKRLRIVALGLGLLFLGVLFLTDSGGGWIAVTGGIVFVLISWRLWTIRVVMPVVGAIAAVVFLFYDKVLWLRYSFSVASLSGRIVLWRETIHLINGWSIVTGLGLGTWLEVYQNHYDKFVTHVHNSYLQLYTDTGIMGVITLIVAVVVFVRLSINILSSSKQNIWYGIGIGLIGSIIAGAIFACYDVTTTGIVLTADSYINLSVPLLWIWAALFVVCHDHLSAQISDKSSYLKSRNL